MDISYAKKIYFEHGCSHFFMWKEGVDKEYEAFHIPASMEMEWDFEYIESKFKAIENAPDFDFSWMLSDLIRVTEKRLNRDSSDQILAVVDNHYEKLDSFSKMLICETTVEYLKSLLPTEPQYAKTQLHLVELKLRQLLRELKRHKFTVNKRDAEDSLLQEEVLNPPLLKKRIECDIQETKEGHSEVT